MPVEVRELVIKAVIDEQTEKKESGNAAGKIDKEEIIADCLDQVKEIMKKDSER